MGKILITPQNGFNFCRIQDAEISNEIKAFQAELAKYLEDDVDSLMKSVTGVRVDLESLKCDVFNNFLKEREDYFRRRMFDLQGKIMQLKETIKKELFTLVQNEAASLKELQVLEQRTEEWEKSFNPQILKQPKLSFYKIHGSDGHPAAEFQKFLFSSGGHCGGWPEPDHLLFLRERKKYKRKEKFITILCSLLPDYSHEEISEHENWYTKYECLKTSQKEAIEKWKQETKVRQQQEEVLEDKQEKKSIKKSINQQRNITERIKEWKNQQMIKKFEEEERQKREREKLKEEERKKREIQKMKKSAVNQFKAEKLIKTKEEPAKNKETEAQDTKTRKILLKAFRMQDVKYTERKKMIRLQLETRSERLRLTKPAIEVILRRDPQRIFQPTLIWNQHCLEAQKREKVTPAFDLNSIPRLAIPEWRRELK